MLIPPVVNRPPHCFFIWRNPPILASLWHHGGLESCLERAQWRDFMVRARGDRRCSMQVQGQPTAVAARCGPSRRCACALAETPVATFHSVAQSKPKQLTSSRNSNALSSVGLWLSKGPRRGNAAPASSIGSLLQRRDCTAAPVQTSTVDLGHYPSQSPQLRPPAHQAGQHALLSPGRPPLREQVAVLEQLRQSLLQLRV